MFFNICDFIQCDEGDEDDVRTDNNGGEKQNGTSEKPSIASLTCYDTVVIFTD